MLNYNDILSIPIRAEGSLAPHTPHCPSPETVRSDFFTFSLQDGFKMPSRWDPGLFWAPSWGPKSTKIGPKSDLKCDQFFAGFENRFLKRFGAILAASWRSLAHLGSKFGGLGPILAPR